MNVAKYPISLTFRKKDEMINFSQLDILHLLERALRRSILPLYFTQGFNPHVKISFLSGLKVGEEGTIDTVFYFNERITAEALRRALSPQLPQGLEISQIEEK